jgi:hypothetical protein
LDYTKGSIFKTAKIPIVPKPQKPPKILELFSKAYLIQELLESGLSQADIARRFQTSRARICQLMKLNRLSDNLKEEIQRNPKNYTERKLREKVI